MNDAGERGGVASRLADDRLVATIGTALIALHVVDDNFVQPRPGTSAGDHLVSGLIPVAALALAALALGRLRPSRRGWLTLAIGVAGLIAGSEAAYDLWTGAVAGDDYTGLVALVAGVLLIALGARGVWRSRRRDGSLARIVGRRALLGAVAVVVAVFVVFPLGLGYGVTHIASPDVPAPALGAEPEEVTFRTDDGLELSGWYIPSRNRAAVIVTGMSRGSGQEEAGMLIRRGYGVLIYDQRGWGASQGDPNAFGWRGGRDVAGAVAYARSRPDVDPGRVGGLGLSVGGEMMITGAAGTPALAAVASEGAGERSVRETVEADSGWLAVPFQAVVTASVALFSNGWPPPGLADLSARVAPRPLLLVYGEDGQPLERTLNPVYAEAAGPSAELWEVPGAAHIGGLEAQPAEYERRVAGFFDDALLGR